MKIVNKKEFYKLPEGTLYSEYDPCIFHSLFIKEATLYNSDRDPIDYVEMDLIGNLDVQNSDEYIDTLDISEKTGNSFKLDFENYGRNGMYQDDQLYAVYEKEDIEGLINVLKQCVPYE